MISIEVSMLNNIEGKDFSFIKGERYKAIDGDELGIEGLKDKILVLQPNSPKRNDRWCIFYKSCIGKTIEIA